MAKRLHRPCLELVFIVYNYTPRAKIPNVFACEELREKPNVAGWEGLFFSPPRDAYRWRRGVSNNYASASLDPRDNFLPDDDDNDLKRSVSPPPSYDARFFLLPARDTRVYSGALKHMQAIYNNSRWWGARSNKTIFLEIRDARVTRYELLNIHGMTYLIVSLCLSRPSV